MNFLPAADTAMPAMQSDNRACNHDRNPLIRAARAARQHRWETYHWGTHHYRCEPTQSEDHSNLDRIAPKPVRHSQLGLECECSRAALLQKNEDNQTWNWRYLYVGDTQRRAISFLFKDLGAEGEGGIT